MRHFLYQCMLFKVGSKFLQESNISFRYHCIDATLPVPNTAIMTVKKIECLSNHDTKFRQVLEAYIFYNLTSKFLPKNMQKNRNGKLRHHLDPYHCHIVMISGSRAVVQFLA